MLDFNDIKVLPYKKGTKIKSEETEQTKIVESIVTSFKKREAIYVIGIDPFDRTEKSKDGGKEFNVFKIFDKINLKYTTRVVTKKSFNEFVEWWLSQSTIFKSDYFVSYKFINNDKTGN